MATRSDVRRICMSLPGTVEGVDRFAFSVPDRKGKLKATSGSGGAHRVPADDAPVVRRAVAGDESILRDLRLEALTDTPHAFESTYEREVTRTAADWQRWISTGATFLLEHSGKAMGMVAGKHDADDAAVVHLVAMWVHPTLRGSGGADALVAALLAWARAEGAGSVQLEVVLSNTRARRFYERHGFHLTGHQVVNKRDGQIDVPMERTL